MDGHEVPGYSFFFGGGWYSMAVYLYIYLNLNIYTPTKYPVICPKPLPQRVRLKNLKKPLQTVGVYSPLEGVNRCILRVVLGLFPNSQLILGVSSQLVSRLSKNAHRVFHVFAVFSWWGPWRQSAGLSLNSAEGKGGVRLNLQEINEKKSRFF